MKRLFVLLQTGKVAFLACTTLLPYTMTAQASNSPQSSDWNVYGGNKAGQRYSPLTQINRANVKHLRVAWKFDTGESSAGLQTHPLIGRGRMFVYSPEQVVFGLDAATGKQLWKFDSGIRTGLPNRGFAYWKAPDQTHDILFASTLYAVWALNPSTGQPILSFGRDGYIDLRDDLGPASPKGTVAMTTPGTIYKDLLITGFRTGETAPSPHGDIRAYNIHTGALVWSFHTIPHPGESGYETWPREAWKYTGGASSWAGGVLDERRGIFYAPTGNPVSDFYGADRVGNDLYANSLLALNAETGKLLWYFQGVHHDMWDRDFPSPPVLLTLHVKGKSIDAVAQVTKHGQVFVFDRATGKPVFPIEEKPFPPSTVPGELASPTQPVSTAIAPFARQRLTEQMLTTRTPELHAWAIEKFRAFISDGQFVPFRVDQETVVFPGFGGGAEWGGEAADPRTGVIYINSNDVAWTSHLRAAESGEGLGAKLYNTQCAECHGTDRKGQANIFPSLIEATKTLSALQMTEVIEKGRGRMPAFTSFSGDSLKSLLDYIRGGDLATTKYSAKQESTTNISNDAITPTPPRYHSTGYHMFLAPDGYPAIQPPWGTLNALDLNTGRYLWRVPLGEYPELAAKGMGKSTGSENTGGPLLTATGLLFIGATNFDNKMRCFDAKTGKLLWEYVMDYAGNATPATYMVNGKQYIVIANSSAHNSKAKRGTGYVAFALQ